jgi:hypothetical protein
VGATEYVLGHSKSRIKYVILAKLSVAVRMVSAGVRQCITTHASSGEPIQYTATAALHIYSTIHIANSTLTFCADAQRRSHHCYVCTAGTSELCRPSLRVHSRCQTALQLPVVPASEPLQMDVLCMSRDLHCSAHLHTSAAPLPCLSSTGCSSSIQVAKGEVCVSCVAMHTGSVVSVLIYIYVRITLASAVPALN